MKKGWERWEDREAENRKRRRTDKGEGTEEDEECKMRAGGSGRSRKRRRGEMERGDWDRRGDKEEERRWREAARRETGCNVGGGEEGVEQGEKEKGGGGEGPH